MTSGTRRVGKVAAIAAMAAVLVTGASSLSTAAPAPVPAGHGAHEPANVGQVKNDVKKYYGDRVDAQGRHQASPDSAWARDTRSQIDRARHHLQARLHAVRNPAIVLDIDDTSELTYSYEVSRDFAFDQRSFDEAVNTGAFPAIEATRELTLWAKRNGVKVYFVTGRRDNLTEGTRNSLRKNGYPEPDGLFLKPSANPPAYLKCGTQCSTVEYKSGTRAFLESQGNTIVLNIGDQYSDLEGGHAERGVKLPNPMYYLP
ncbi:HAD superfamily, subfamily IIIB (Acid phosphatase) [Streptoalloteichus tenebrarius]|uniref:HAD superfamily, subfamily IIIB (Acid phosphatase) n=1 Tax=Streptoalloteichus tenebrarius (strain ATCC 17920 / DSM 40477 / JCM 4838 / CBS 697.72 / NBRC 16177 / NCIMB 11028 / NRRL B-12390 / A12253. 1 / ISP 5477) TaxID=1933 RepID=A0ABT1HWL8_STRSD|nr:HAD family acid phosphatase [Streptoalloteichus tenebrarius]MCP2259900.1 HAD superfamily, subfamily IIIB (Acid phosphatase) [Streptoalloteichus tenebrarius]BFF03225.1 HAD family acid phosphatase [Streptoalloteichus tenebrarius]